MTTTSNQLAPDLDPVVACMSSGQFWPGASRQHETTSLCLQTCTLEAEIRAQRSWNIHCPSLTTKGFRKQKYPWTRDKALQWKVLNVLIYDIYVDILRGTKIALALIPRGRVFSRTSLLAWIFIYLPVHWLLNWNRSQTSQLQIRSTYNQPGRLSRRQSTKFPRQYSGRTFLASGTTRNGPSHASLTMAWSDQSLNMGGGHPP